MAAPMRFVYIWNKHKLYHNNDLIFQISNTTVRKYSSKNVNPFNYCVESVRKYDYENYLCSLLLPESIRSSALVIRAFNVEISQIRDLVSTSAIGEMRIRFWHDTLNQIFAGNPPEQPVARELSKVLRKHKLSKAWFQRLIVSRENILSDKPFLSIKEVEEYCDNSVAPLYFLILQALGVNNVHCDHAASHIGKAQGICNLIRGIPYNSSKRRSFLPLELMSKHKISQEELIRGNQMKNLQDAVYDISTVAHQHLSMARKLNKDVLDKVKPVFLPAVASSAYLKSLEKTDFDVFHSKNQKRNTWLPALLLFHKLRNKY